MMHAPCSRPIAARADAESYPQLEGLVRKRELEDPFASPQPLQLTKAADEQDDDLR